MAKEETPKTQKGEIIRGFQFGFGFSLAWLLTSVVVILIGIAVFYLFQI